ncbi:hypothetical protein VTI74DRAFT_7927 [Chaetomium olivicolor]
MRRNPQIQRTATTAVFYPCPPTGPFFCNIIYNLLNPLRPLADVGLDLLNSAPLLIKAMLIKTMRLRRLAGNEMTYMKMVEDFVAKLARLGEPRGSQGAPAERHELMGERDGQNMFKLIITPPGFGLPQAEQSLFLAIPKPRDVPFLKDPATITVSDIRKNPDALHFLEFSQLGSARVTNFALQLSRSANWPREASLPVYAVDTWLVDFRQMR